MLSSKRTPKYDCVSLNAILEAGTISRKIALTICEASISSSVVTNFGVSTFSSIIATGSAGAVTLLGIVSFIFNAFFNLS